MRTFGRDLASLVPADFTGYARVLHPAHRGPEQCPVRWADVAAANGRVAHPEMQWANIADTSSHISPRPDIWTDQPCWGELPAPEMGRLVDLLSEHTETRDRIWFAIWDGWGTPTAGHHATAHFDLPGRRYKLVTAPIDAARTGVAAVPDWTSPQIWWSDDRAWIVASEIDLCCTYVGGSAACIATLLTDASLEVLPVDIHHRFTFAADTVNPLPLPGAPR